MIALVFRLRTLALFALAALLGSGPLAGGVHAQGGDVLIPKGAVWKYLDDGSDQGTAWKEPGYNDAGWAAGAAKLGYGDSDVVTEVTSGPFPDLLPDLKYVTTYFRRAFQVTNPANYSSLTLRLQRDDGAVIFLNGVEVARSNFLPFVPVLYDTFALSNVSGSDEDVFHTISLPTAALVAGTNVLAVEIHQSALFSSDIGFDCELEADSNAGLLRGPYLQRGTPTGVTFRWRTDAFTASRVWYGLSPGNLNQSVADATHNLEHELPVSGLSPGTKYYYAVGFGNQVLAGGDSEHFFVTPPVPGTDQPTRVWVLGDSGTANANAAAVRDAYYDFTGDTHTDLWLMLGDNAYNEGTDVQYQAAVFDMYPEMLRKSVLWPARGNHDDIGFTYFGIFTMPSAGEAGGMPSGTEAYYSFDHANIHFICLDSFFSLLLPGTPMWTWLENDLASTDADWIIAYWHHPPYSKGSHDSDTELQMIQLRTFFLPLLEAAGVDLVLTGHSHGYERSFLIDGHYGFSGSFDSTFMKDSGNGRPDQDGAYHKAPIPHAGTVYCVAGCSGKQSGGSYDHPVMFHSLSTMGSLVLDVDGGRLDATFLDINGEIEDYFSLVTYPDEGLSSDTTTLTLSAGGTQSFDLDAGPAHAGRLYLLLGSSSGTVPGVPVDSVLLPLNVDNYTLFTLNSAGSGPLQNTLGFLDAQGTASAALNVPGGLSPNLDGLTLHHAFAVLDVNGSGQAVFASNAFPLTFLP